MTKPIDVAQMRQLLRTITASRRVGGRSAPKPHALDQSQIDEIRGSLGQDKLIRLLRLVRYELAARPAVIRQIAERRDFARVRSEAHSLAGAVASFGVVGVALAAKAVEQAAPGIELELALGQLDREAKRARSALDPLISDHPAKVAANA